MKISNTPNVVPENPLDKLECKLCFIGCVQINVLLVNSKEFADGIINIAKILKITPHPDPFVTLKAASKVITTRLSPQALENPNEVIIKVVL